MLKALGGFVATGGGVGAVTYKGTWNASTNTPTLVSSTGTQGDYYVVNVAGSTNLDGLPIGRLATGPYSTVASGKRLITPTLLVL
jgi:hypothetical protein